MDRNKHNLKSVRSLYAECQPKDKFKSRPKKSTAKHETNTEDFPSPAQRTTANSAGDFNGNSNDGKRRIVLMLPASEMKRHKKKKTHPLSKATTTSTTKNKKVTTNADTNITNTNPDHFNKNQSCSDGRRKRLTQGCTSLMYACQQGNTEVVVQELRTKPEKILQRDRRNKTALHYCSRQSDLVAAASLTAAAPELLEAADEDGFTPLHLAVIQGNLAMVNLLLANKADVNAVDNEGHSVVHWATVCGEVDALRAVLQAGANVATPDINGGSPLHYAAQMCGANYEGKLSQSSKLAVEILSILLAHPQSSVDVTDKDGRQPLLWAASAGSAKAVISLVKAGARVESSDKDGLTALHCAASRGHTECIDTIISLCGAPTDLIDSNGCTSLHYSVTLGHADATSRLLDLEADPNRQDRKGRTPAHCGCAKGQLETVKLLKDNGANLWLRNAKGDLPLHEAASSGRRELVEWLLDMKPKQVNTTSNDGRTMLHIAAGNDYTDMCKMLIDFGGDVNSVYRNSKGVVMTPLDCALQKGFRSTAKFLQSINGLPASKLRLSGRHPNAFNDHELVKPLKYIEKEEVRDLKAQKKYVMYLKNSDESESAECSCSEHLYKKEHRVNHVCRQHRKKFRRRTSSCGGFDDGLGTVCRRKGNTCSDMCRSKSNIEIRRKRSRDRIYTSDDNDSCEVCCRHKRLTKTKKKDRCSRRSRDILVTDEDDDEDDIDEHSRRKLHRKDSKRNRAVAEYEDLKEAKTQQNLQELEVEGKISRPFSGGSKKPRPLSAKKRQTKESTFIKQSLSPIENSNKILPTAAALDLTDEEDIVDSEIVVTQVQVHKENEMPSFSEELHVDTDTKSAVVEEISKEVNEVLKNAAEAVESLAEKQETLFGDVDALTISEPSTANIVENGKDEIDLIRTEKLVKDCIISDSELKITTENSTAPEVNTADQTLLKPNDEEMNKTIIDPLLCSNEKPPTPLLEKESLNNSNLNTFVQAEPEMTKTGSDTATETVILEKIQSKDLTVSANEKVLEHQAHPLSAITPDTKISQDPVREQEGRKSFTLLSEVPVISTSGVIMEDDKGVRKSSFTVLKSDASVEVEDASGNFAGQVGSTSFQVVGAKTSAGYSSEEGNGIHHSNEINVRRTDGPGSGFAHDNSPTSDFHSRKRRLKRRVKSGSKARSWRAQSDGEIAQQISKDQDSGFEPSPRAMKSKIPPPRSIYTAYVPRKTIYATLDARSCSSRAEGRKPGDKNSCNMTAVTRSIHRNIRRYYMERKIFQHLLELKSLQIRSSKLNESVLVKRAVDDYHKSCIALGAETGGTLRRYAYTDYTFKNFEMFLYETLKSLQKPGTYNFQNINEVYEEAERRLSPDYNTYEKALRCTTKTHRCLHAAHAYTGIPCAAYIPLMNHHTMPKFGYGSYKKAGGVGSFYLPKILTTQSKCPGGGLGGSGIGNRNANGCATKVSLELSHGKNKQLISLPSEKLDSNKRYYVTFTVKGSGEGTVTGGHDNKITTTTTTGTATTKIELSDSKSHSH